MARLQATLKKTISCEGVALHSGVLTTLQISPADVNTGYVFVRSDVQDNNQIVGKYNNVVDTVFCTKLANEHGVSISTVEHVLAALAGAHVTNAIITVSGPEVPIMDGSSVVFSKMIDEGGIEPQSEMVPTIKVLKPIRVEHGDAFAEFDVASRRTISMRFDYHGRLKGLVPVDSLSFDWDGGGFNADLANARTFGFYEDAQNLIKMGLAKGASLENTVVVKDADSVMNPEGLRSADELIRHKLLDAVGDLALAGVEIEGKFSGYNSGHGLNNKLLRSLFADKEAWEYCL